MKVKKDIDYTEEKIALIENQKYLSAIRNLFRCNGISCEECKFLGVKDNEENYCLVDTLKATIAEMLDKLS